MPKALLIIDVQKAFDFPEWGERNNPEAEETISALLTKWRKTVFEVIFIQHTSEKPDSMFYPDNEGFQIKELVKPQEDEKIITKVVNSAFIGTTLESYLKEAQIKELVITGLTTPHCISTTTRMSGNLGFKTFILSDATAAFGLTNHKGEYLDPQTVHDVSLATIHEEFATVLTTEDYINNYLLKC